MHDPLDEYGVAVRFENHTPGPDTCSAAGQLVGHGLGESREPRPAGGERGMARSRTSEL
ncbi:hypothetical protein Ssi02_74570 [Sinosporangium siamense]|uniref:Uncharacterized protein n=1 Tax=Sinosporangium siamense TaxID=1367973 RepID=A0A919RRL3_9ACTN|nr:hypothetical protein Ssi02_74570 [Sinosporangium siamense]